jgi:hypothetical protein
MQYGKTILHFEAGEIKGVYTNAGLDQLYYIMFKKAKGIARRYPQNPENGIKVIIFGAFYLEATCNVLFRKMLSSQISQNKLANSIWGVMERLNVRDKLKIASKASSLNNSNVEKYLKKAQKIFDFRNRLAHFKEEDRFWLGEIKTENTNELLRVLTQAPEPELVKELTGNKILKYAYDIEELDKWMNVLFNHFFKFKTESIKIIGSRKSSKK